MPVFHQIATFVGAFWPVLIEGEGGVGKQVIARAIFERMTEHRKQIVKVSCGPGIEGIPFDEVLASRGLFLDDPRAGAVLFHHVSLLSAHWQRVLAELLESRLTECIQVFSTTTCPLEAWTVSGLFRGDLYNYLRTVHIIVPPLRERRREIPVLAQHFVRQYAEERGCEPRPLSDRLVEALTQASWPGNVRQLQSVMQGYVLLKSEDAIIADLQFNNAETAPTDR